jgi:hypothetical protein
MSFDTNQNSFSRAKSSLSFKSSNSDYNSIIENNNNTNESKVRFNSASTSRMNMYSARRHRIVSSLEKNPIQVQKFAEDILNDHFEKSLDYKLKNQEPVKKIKPG